MNCPKCGTNIDTDSHFCKNCGERINNEHQNQYDYSYKYSNITNKNYNEGHQEQFNYSYNYSNTTTPNYNMNANHQDQFNYSYNYTTNSTSSDDKYLEAYVGPNYNQIKNSKISIPAFIFGAYYLLYRKVWGYAILYIIISFAASLLVGDSAESVVELILRIFLCLKFNELYLKKAENEVDKIKQGNLDKTSQELMDICKKKGGTSIAAPIITTIVMIIGVFALMAAYITNNIIQSESEYETKHEQEEVFDSKNQVQNLTYAIPEGFELTYSSGNYRSFRYSDPTTNTQCFFTIDTNKFTSLYPTAEEYLKKHVITTNANETLNPIAPITYNNTEWKYLHLESNVRSETQYATINNDLIYVIKTYDYKQNGQSNTICNEKYSNLLNSTNIKM